MGLVSLHLVHDPRWAWLGLLLLGLMACGEKVARRSPPVERLFTQLPTRYTGVQFSNDLNYTEAFNPYTFRNFYNGGGVALGDVNNDGRVDLYFCGNQVENKLYLNRGDFAFEDVTDLAGVACPAVWSSGVSLADVNGDGWLDLYVCKSGSPEGDNRYNELFINDANPDENGVVTFTEQSARWGLDDLGLSTHAAFFDYDRDGDLDCYLLNNSLRSVGGYDLVQDQREIPDTLGGNKLYRHDGDHYTDVSLEAGIYTSAIGFGLGVTIGDVNRDGWLDIYVSNDFFERDYLYLNQQDGTFAEVLTEQMPEISLSSMGADLGDLNGDGYPEIFVTDMLPRGDRRMKTKTMFESWDKYQLNLRQGYHRQFTRNMLQLNNGDSSFSEIGRLAGTYATDWSWGALMFDFDNDGYRDIFVANGIYKDLTDQDYINFFASPQAVRRLIQQEDNAIEILIDSIPSEAVSNYAFVQQPVAGSRVPRFANQAEALGLAAPSFSNGSAYGDLDNDGDLDLVINNVNQSAFIYRNESDTLRPDHHWLGLRLKGRGQNRLGLGSRVTLKAGGRTFYQELAPMRGFQSCVDPRLLIGLGEASRIDTLWVQGPQGHTLRRTDLPVDQYLHLDLTDAKASAPAPVGSGSPAGWLPHLRPTSAPAFTHQENEFQDFRRDRLLFHMRSNEGPPLCAADFNRDGREDFFVGGAKQQAGAIFFQQADGSFAQQQVPVLVEDAISEDTDCACFDADGDGDQDLFVASGGNEFPRSSTALLDRLYLNQGGRFTRDDQLGPLSGFRSTGAVAAADYDGDGDVDLFLGTRLQPFKFGLPADGVLLRNQGQGRFQDATASLAPELEALGLITAARWVDLDQDRDLDLVVAGEWMPLTVFSNEGGRLTRQEAGLAQSAGWWHSLAVGDFDEDGDLDLVAGNLGLNTRLVASPHRPARLHVKDFDQNGSLDQIITVYQGEEAYPLVLRPDLVAQMPALKRKYLKHASYAEQTIADMFTPEQRDGSLVQEVYQGASMLFLNRGDGTFDGQPLPTAAQLAPVYAWLPLDVNGDGHLDLLGGGNFFKAKPEVGIYAASYGLWLLGDGKGGFQPVPPQDRHFKLSGEVRSLLPLKTPQGRSVLVGRNNLPLQQFLIREPDS